MQKKLTRLMSLLLCLVIFTGAVACSGEKGASGQKVAAPEVQQGKTVVTHGKHREKTLSSQQCAPERVVVENNLLTVVAPTPVPVLGVPVSPGDQVTKDANDKIASAVDDFFDALDKVTQCSFGRACSSDDSDQGSKPNVAGNMTDEEKTELGGTGSGTGTPPPPENDPKNQNEDKPSNIKMADDDKYLKKMALMPIN